MVGKFRAKADFDPVKNADMVYHYLDVASGKINTSPSSGRRDDFVTGAAVPLTLAAEPCRYIQYELTRERKPNVAERKFPIGMLQHLVQGDYHVVLSEHQIGGVSIPYMRLGAKPFPSRLGFPARPRIARSEPEPGELKVDADNVDVVTRNLGKGHSIRALMADGTYNPSTDPHLGPM